MPLHYAVYTLPEHSDIVQSTFSVLVPLLNSISFLIYTDKLVTSPYWECLPVLSYFFILAYSACTLSHCADAIYLRVLLLTNSTGNISVLLCTDTLHLYWHTLHVLSPVLSTCTINWICNISILWNKAILTSMKFVLGYAHGNRTRLFFTSVERLTSPLVPPCQVRPL